MRLAGYDYSQLGAYFVTIVTLNRECLFGEVVNGEMAPNGVGEAVTACWHEIRSHFPTVEPDAFVLMPNHVHGILVIADSVGAGSSRPQVPPILEGGSQIGAETPKGAETAPLQRPTLGQVVAYFKYQSTKVVNGQRGTPSGRVWQRNYYEHVIRGEDELDRVCQYIQGNPGKWELDPENPARQAAPARNGTRRGAVSAPSGV